MRTTNHQKLTSLLMYLGLSERIIQNTNQLTSVFEENINFGEVDRILDAERERTEIYLIQNVR